MDEPGGGGALTSEAAGRPKRGATLDDVARRAGYSKSTASLVFRDSPLVAETTRARVLEAASELGYIYNRRAAGLRFQRSHTIGLLVAGVTNPFLAALTEAIEKSLAPLRYTVVLGNTLDDIGHQADLMRTMLEYRVDGLLVVPAIGSLAQTSAAFEGLETPLVTLTRRSGGRAVPYVGSDDRGSAHLAAIHLHEHGCRSIAYFGGPDLAETRAERRSGVEAAAAATGMIFDDRWSPSTATTSTAGRVAAAGLLGVGGHPPDGIVVHGDSVAFGVMRALRDAGYGIGSDVRVIGFDDIEFARDWSPSLSSIALDARAMGQAAVDLLLRRIDRPDDPPESVLLETTLHLRESCGEHAGR